MNHLTRVATCATVVALAAAPCLAAASRLAPDTLFRTEVAEAAHRIGWKGAPLADDTAFAVAATGLSWSPEWNGQPLIQRSSRGATADYAPEATRREAFLSLRGSGDDKTTFAFALSLVLAPAQADTELAAADRELERHSEDYERALVGVVEAPDRLPLLQKYRYSAADALVRRDNARLLPFFLSLAQSDDSYLRSRGVAGLGVLAYQDVANRAPRGLHIELRESPISATQQQMVDDALVRAAADRAYRVRAAAAFAMGLIADASYSDTLHKLLRDSSYVVEGPSHPARAVVFPVRTEAALALERIHGEDAADARYVAGYEGRDAARARRGARDVTGEWSEPRRHGRAVGIPFTDGDW